MDFFLPDSIKYNTDFRDHKSFENRRAESSRLIRKYNDRVPIVIEPSRELNIDKKKFLSPGDISVSQFMYIIRKRIRGLSPAQAIFLFTENNTFPPSSTLMSDVYYNYHNRDGMLYVKIGLESVYGGMTQEGTSKQASRR